MDVMTDDHVLEALRKQPRLATYVVKNILRETFRSATTSQVRRALKRLEKAGPVREVPTSYAVMLTWEPV